MAKARWTAEDWDRSENAEDMLQALRGRRRKIDRRALRLFSVALCQRFRRVVTAPQCLSALNAAERDAGEPLDRAARLAARTPAMEAVRLLVPRSIAAFDGGEVDQWREAMIAEASTAFVHVLDAAPLAGATAVSTQIAEAAAWELVRLFGGEGWEEAREAELLIHADLLRHILGNPFRPVPAPPPLPDAVVQLAEALEAGEPVAFALGDALLEAGQTELAEHFIGDAYHPRGCWALEAIKRLVI